MSDVFIIDESGNQFVDESGNHLVDETEALASSLFAACAGTGSVVANLTTSIIPTGSEAGSSSASAALLNSIEFQAVAAGQSLSTGTLFTALTLSASASAVASVSAELSTGIGFNAAVSGQSSAAGELSTVLQLSALVSGSVSAAGQLSTELALVASATGQVSVSVDLETTIGFSAETAGSSNAVALFSADDECLSATASGTSFCNGELTTQILLSGTVAANSSSTAAFPPPELYYDLSVVVANPLALQTVCNDLVINVTNPARLITAVTDPLDWNITTLNQLALSTSWSDEGLTVSVVKPLALSVTMEVQDLIGLMQCRDNITANSSDPLGLIAEVWDPLQLKSSAHILCS